MVGKVSASAFVAVVGGILRVHLSFSEFDDAS